jgi:photosystem II stability/assembly factor-like uncharacterized protein
LAPVAPRWEWLCPGDSIVYAFAATTGDTAQLDLFRSTDGGQTWVRLNITSKVAVNPNFDQPNLDLMGGQAFYNQMIRVDPADGTRNTVYLSGSLSMARTKDGGNTWTADQPLVGILRTALRTRRLPHRDLGPDWRDKSHAGRR